MHQNNIIRQIGASVITAGLPEIVSAGLNLVIGSFICSSTTTQSPKVYIFNK